MEISASGLEMVPDTFFFSSLLNVDGFETRSLMRALLRHRPTLPTNLRLLKHRSRQRARGEGRL